MYVCVYIYIERERDTQNWNFRPKGKTTRGGANGVPQRGAVTIDEDEE